ncbi:MAG: Ig-like domain-containing protein [Saprospiraceae bacterium]|nr:Ig-like domain-containing protein [Saprospiraceae bacterium]
MKSIIKFSYVFIFLLGAISCSDDTGGLEIIIHSPEDNATFSQGDTITLEYTVRDDTEITTIAWFGRDLGTGSVSGTDLLKPTTEYSGQFVIVADVEPGTYEISVSATDENMEHVIEEIVTVIIE